MPTDITQVEGPLAGFRQGMLDTEKVRQAPLETDLLRAHAGKAALDLRNQQKMMELMSQQGYGAARQGDTVADHADYFGNLFMQSGQPEKALKAFGEGSLMRARAATADASTTRAILNRGRALTQELETYERYMSGATDQASFDSLNAAYFGATGKVGMLAGHQYSPQVISELTKQAMGAKDRLNAGMRAQENMSRDKLRERREAELDALDKYREWHKDFMERQEQRRVKAGGKGIASPSKDEQTETIRLIKRDYPELYQSDPEATQNAAFSIAARAKELKHQNPALESKEAIARAYTEAVTAGEFKRQEAKKVLGFTVKGAETKFLGEGKTAETAMKLPQQPSASSLTKGKFYINDKGQIAQWTGTGFSAVAQEAEEVVDTEDEEDED